jgi:hypothetical protein
MEHYTFGEMLTEALQQLHEGKRYRSFYHETSR